VPTQAKVLLFIGGPPPAENTMGVTSLSIGVISFRVAVALVLFIAVWAYLDTHLDKFAVFDQNKLHEIAKVSIAKKHNTTHDLIHHLVSSLAK
jgi:hypothetical protein